MSTLSAANSLKRPLISRIFNVLHYSTVALLVGSSLFLAVNVFGAARAKRKSFREERDLAMQAAIEKQQNNQKEN